MKISILNVQGKEIALTTINDTDYISLTDMIKSEEGEDHIRNWMRNKNTIEFLGIWETLNNPDFKGVEFDTFKIWVVQCLPNTKEFNGIFVSHPVPDMVFAFFTFDHIG